MKPFNRILDGIATFGVALTGWRVLPHLWDTNILDFAIVGGCLLLFGVMLAHKALTGEWPS